MPTAPRSATLVQIGIEVARGTPVQRRAGWLYRRARGIGCSARPSNGKPSFTVR